MLRKWKLLLLAFCAAMATNVTLAQETTATLTGLVTDEGGAVIPGVSITIKHIPTGYVTYSQTNEKGRFVVPNLKSGGPYTVTFSVVGFKEESLTDVNLVLGENPDFTQVMRHSVAELKEVTVNAGRRAPAASLVVGKTQLNTLPSLGRSLGDFTRLTPQSNNNSFAGTNFRYNNFTLDGAINNDAIGFSNSFGGQSGGGQSGTAGSGTRTNPYSIETIQEVQVQLAPYDVKLGNFTGGSVNAVTKSGTNQFHGSVYGYGRGQALMGKSVDGLKTSIGSDFHDYQTGFTLGGPIVKNKAFFFASYEKTDRQEPTFYNAGDPGAAMTIAEAQQIVDFMKSKYNYDPGSYGPYKIFTKSDKFFGRLDFNINPSNTLTIRALYTNGRGNNLERTTTNFQFSSTDFTQYDKNLNMVAELKSKFSNTASNQLIVSYINVHEYRTYPTPLDANGNPSGLAATPLIDIDNGRIWLGTWREASVYNMKQQTIEFTDNVTVSKGINKFTFGTHNEFYNLTYGFLNSWNGRWEYAGGLNGLFAGTPSRIRGVFPESAVIKNNRDDLYNSVAGSNYKVGLTSLYAEDEISSSNRFKITPGIRIDYPFLNKSFPIDAALNSTQEYISANPTYTHTPFSQLDNKWLGKPTLSPRVGFTWDIRGDKSLVLRGGSGIFVGRMPFAWLGYASTLTGTNFGNIDYKPGGTVVGLANDPTALKDTVNAHSPASSTTRELDIVDNNFKLPEIWRTNAAIDIKFGNGYKLTFDAMYTKTIYDVKFQQINIKDSVQYYTSGPTQTPYYVG
ncbi:MAG TPA: carboxypeptidase regulatory-like domain-containing protein, partial [Chitinophagaceae bacterium]|nr:carboxypeptidase regulatory-like domain-containing protein [Chitinophagaceae bacterium]